MLYCRKYSVLCAFFMVVTLMGGCQRDAFGPQACEMGTIVLAEGMEGVFSYDTKAVVNFTDEQKSKIVFTLDGTDANGVTVSNKVVTFTNSEASVPAGTYTLRANYRPDAYDSGNGAMCFAGTSSEFTVNVGKNTAVSIHLLPSNARINVEFDASFRLFYSVFSINFGAPREYSVSDNASVYFEPGTVSFSLEATARSNTSAAGNDINISGQNITLSAADSYTLTIAASPDGTILFNDPSSTSSTWDKEFS